MNRAVPPLKDCPKVNLEELDASQDTLLGTGRGGFRRGLEFSVWFELLDACYFSFPIKFEIKLMN